jgi:hypothetical protein
MIFKAVHSIYLFIYNKLKDLGKTNGYYVQKSKPNTLKLGMFIESKRSTTLAEISYHRWTTFQSRASTTPSEIIPSNIRYTPKVAK